jgi:hypothetical protein
LRSAMVVPVSYRASVGLIPVKVQNLKLKS